MRDERFSWAFAYEERQHEQDAKADAYLEALGDRGPLEQRFQEWWSREREQPHEGYAESFLPAASERLAKMCVGLDSRFQPLVEVLPSALANSSDASSAMHAAQKLIGRSIALSLVHQAPDAAAFDQGARFLRGCWTAATTFLETFIQAVPQHLQGEWTLLLRELPSELPALLGIDSYARPPPLDHLQEREQELRAKGLAAYLWDRHDERCRLKGHWLQRGRVLLAWDTGAFASAVESLPLRELRTDCLHGLRLWEDKEAILGLLRAAPPVFAGDGWTGQVVALLALELAIQYTDELQSVVKRAAAEGMGFHDERKAQAALMLSQLESTELPQWLRDVFAALLQRVDGRQLLLFFAAHLIGMATRPRSWRRNTWSSLGITLEAMESQLSPRPMADEVKAVARLGRTQQGETREEMASLLTVALLGEDFRGTWDWYAELLQTPPDDLLMHIRSGTEGWVYACLGSALLRLADPLMEWSEAWRRLFVPDRERARFNPFDFNALLPSVHLVLVGFGLLHDKERPKHLSDPKAEKLWRELRRAVLVLTQGSVESIEHLPKTLVGYGFELAARLFGTGWPRLLDESLEWLKGGLERQVYVAEALLRGRIPRDDVLAQMAQRGCDPLAALGQLEPRFKRDEILASAAARLRSPQETG